MNPEPLTSDLTLKLSDDDELTELISKTNIDHVLSRSIDADPRDFGKKFGLGSNDRSL